MRPARARAGWAARCSVACLALVVAPPPSVVGPPADSIAGRAAAHEVERKDSARAQLEHAVRRKRELRGRTGTARSRARNTAVAAYRAVRTYFPAEGSLGAEASFRAGELLRAGGFERAAVLEFEQARKLGAGTAFRARGGLELGHLHRRADRLQKALAAYEGVIAMGRAERQHRDRATHWAGRVHEELGRPADARRCWERVARNGEDPVSRIAAFDAWAHSLVAGRDLEGAAGVLELCRAELEDVALEETRLGLRVRSALERMSSVNRLKRAIESRLRKREGGPRPKGGAAGSDADQRPAAAMRRTSSAARGLPRLVRVSLAARAPSRSPVTALARPRLYQVSWSSGERERACE